MSALANLTNGGGGGAVVNGSNGSVTLSTIADNQFYARRKNPPGSRVNVVLGAQWGDEGKGKMVDMLATTADVVCRCQVSVSLFFLLPAGLFRNHNEQTNEFRNSIPTLPGLVM